MVKQIVKSEIAKMAKELGEDELTVITAMQSGVATFEANVTAEEILDVLCEIKSEIIESMLG